MGHRTTNLFISMAIMATLTSAFQNCSKAKFQFVNYDSKATLCGTQSCSLTPLTHKPAVTTILLALGDEKDSKLVGNPVSNQYLVESVIRFSSPVHNPKILIVRALDNGDESPEDTIYIQRLLSRYSSHIIDEPSTGLEPAHVAGYDLVWFNNPGYPFSLQKSYQTLLSFDGGVVLQGDDMSYGATFSLTELTGLTHIDNGYMVRCGGVDYLHDDNKGEKYRVRLDPAKIEGISSAEISFRYGNDIDNTVIADPSVEVIALAKGGPSSCVQERPAVVRKLK